MNTNIITKIIALVFCALIFASAIAAQSKAWKFDEFNEVSENLFYSYFEEISNSQRVERFIGQLKKERGIKAYIIYYTGRVTTDADRYKIRNETERFQYQIRNGTRIKVEDILIIDGGFRENNAIEFWIAPKNAEPPPTTPTFAQSETFICPKIAVYSETPLNETEIVNFSLSENSFKGFENHSPVWKVSGGEIIEGQGTDNIKVSLKDSTVKQVTAFVEVNGLPLPCPKVSSTTVEMRKKLFPFFSSERYNISYLSAVMDGFMTTLNNNPSAKGYVIVYASRKGGTKEMERAIKSVQNLFVFRNFDVSRITIVKGGYREYNTVDSWLIFDNAAPPIPTPTVDKRFVEISKPMKKRRH